MNIEFYCPLWGREDQPFEEFVSKAAEAGFDGVEMSFPDGDPVERDRRLTLLEAAGLKLVAQHWETENPDPAVHRKEYENRIRFLAEIKPEFISSQTGRDFFAFEDNLNLLATASRVSEETGVKIIHETHRSKLSFAAHVTRRFLEKLPEMRLTLDVSHWFCVHERYLADQADSLTLAIERSDHIHARVGHNQGSQVTDFRMPEWKNALEVHLEVWDRIEAQARSEGRSRLSISPEFGPAPYMLSFPGTDRPLTDQWTQNTVMMALLKERWN